MAAWMPGRRKADRELETPYEDVPDHLAQPLWDWIREGLWGFNPFGMEERTPRITQLAMHLRLPGTLDEGSLVALIKKDLHLMLDVAEAMLELWEWDRGRAEKLAEVLKAANSMYEVRHDWGGLTARIDPAVKQQMQSIVSSVSGSAGQHLTDAWNEAYGRRPDPVKSYSESIKAAESALAPCVSPQNGRQTLGTMIRDVRSKPAKWVFALGDVAVVVAMMEALWNGQTSRHGGVGQTRSESVEEAQAAVHIAAALVQYGTNGAFVQVP